MAILDNRWATDHFKTGDNFLGHIVIISNPKNPAKSFFPVVVKISQNVA